MQMCVHTFCQGFFLMHGNVIGQGQEASSHHLHVISLNGQHSFYLSHFHPPFRLGVSANQRLDIMCNMCGLEMSSPGLRWQFCSATQGHSFLFHWPEVSHLGKLAAKKAGRYLLFARQIAHACHGASQGGWMLSTSSQCMLASSWCGLPVYPSKLWSLLGSGFSLLLMLIVSSPCGLAVGGTAHDALQPDTQHCKPN